MANRMLNLSVNLGRLKLKNPIIAASGTFGFAREFEDFFNLRKLGAIVTKTITLKPRRGNMPPRLIETPCGLLNSIGLENDGYDLFVLEKLPYLKDTGIPIIVSIAGETRYEFVELARRLDKIDGIHAVELNISCPNIRGNPRAICENPRLISQDPKATYNLVKAVRKVCKKTLITKLSPNVTDILKIAEAAKEAGTDSISLVNTFFGMSINIKTRRPHLGSIIGGLSGPAIRPIALAMVYRLVQNLRVPIIGMGGIMDTNDALEFLIAGATAIGTGTANLINPRVSLDILKGIKKYLIKNKIRDIKKLIGSIKI